MNREEPEKFSFPGLIDRSKPRVEEPPKPEEKKEEMPQEEKPKRGRPKKVKEESEEPVSGTNKKSLKLGKIKY